jgi:hypothetical protein
MSVCAIANKEDKVQQFLTLIKDPDVQPVFKNYIETILATSELKILKRLAALETALGLNDFSDFEDEDHELTIPKQLSLLAERIDNITEPVARQEHIKEPVASPKTLTETRACLLVDHMRNRISPRNGEVFLSSHEILTFLEHEIQEEYRANDVKNVRQVKKEVLEKAVEMYSNSVLLSKKKHGRKEVRIVLRSSEDRQSLRTIHGKEI